MDTGDVGPGCHLSLRLVPRYEGVQVSGTPFSTLKEMFLLCHSVTCMVLFQAQGKSDSSNLNLASIHLAEPDLA